MRIPRQLVWITVPLHAALEVSIENCISSSETLATEATDVGFGISTRPIAWALGPARRHLCGVERLKEEIWRRQDAGWRIPECSAVNDMFEFPRESDHALAWTNDRFGILDNKCSASSRMRNIELENPIPNGKRIQLLHVQGCK